MITHQTNQALDLYHTAQEGLERAKAGVVLTKRLAGVAGGAFLVARGLRSKSLRGAAMALVGTDLVYQNVRGEGHLYDAVLGWFDGSPRGLPYGRGVKVKESIVVRKPANELYRIWRDFETLPVFMPHLESVEAIDDKRSHWILKAPADSAIEWDAEVIADRKGELIGWRSANGGVVAHAGSVRFEELADGLSTRVVVALQYNPVGGEGGVAAARLLGSDPKRRIREDLRRFREFSESVDLQVLDKLLHRPRFS